MMIEEGKTARTTRRKTKMTTKTSTLTPAELRESASKAAV